MRFSDWWLLSEGQVLQPLHVTIWRMIKTPNTLGATLQ